MSGKAKSTSSDQASFQDEIEATGVLENGAGESEEVERFKAELAGRDETIRLLLDELSRVEESQTATQAEWEHLADWLDELERRVEGQDGDNVHELENRLAAQEQKAEALLMKLEAGSPRLGGPTAALSEGDRPAPGDVGSGPRPRPRLLKTNDGRVSDDHGPGSEVVKALQTENDRLRAAWQETG